MPKKLTVVVSQSQGKNPAKRNLEENLAAALIMEPDVDCSLVPHLYDMSADHTGMLFLRSVPGDLVVVGWLYGRAMHWILDRQGVKGKQGTTLLRPEDEESDDDEAPDVPEYNGLGAQNVPDRRVYCIDFRSSEDPADYLEEIRRIASETSVQTVDLMQWIEGDPNKDRLQRYLQPDRMLEAARATTNGNGSSNGSSNGSGNGATADDAAAVLPEPAKRRWYPVIDYSRCTNCMECIDFCLFGVYGVDQQDLILVEQQDNCKKGCPACSRVCPENAIIFPGHKTPAIAGADGEVAGLKIDLSKLFGAPEKSPLEMAVAERDSELVADGRNAVGMTVGIPKRQTDSSDAPRDALDDLMDGLDELDL